MSSGIPPKDLVVHREDRQGWVYFNHYSSTNCNVYDVTHATGYEVGLCRPRRKLDHTAAGSVLHYLSEQDGNVYVREYVDLKCRNTKTKWDLATRRFHDVEAEVTISSCTMRSPESDPEHAYSQKVSNDKKLPLYGTYVVSLGFDDYDTCAYTQKLQTIHTATLATHYSAQYGGCQLIDGKYQIFDCSSGSPTLNVYIDKSCSRLAHAIPLGHSCVEGVQDKEYMAYSYWSCSLNGDILPIIQPKVVETSTSYGYFTWVSLGVTAILGVYAVLYLIFRPRKKMKNDEDLRRTPHNFPSFTSPFRKDSSLSTVRRDISNSNMNSNRFTVHPSQPVSAPPVSPLTVRNVMQHNPPVPYTTATPSNKIDVEDQPPIRSNSLQYSMPNPDGAITSSAVAAAAASSGHNLAKSTSSTSLSGATTHANSSPSLTSSSLEQTLSIKDRLRGLRDDDMHKNMPASPQNDLAKKFGTLAMNDDGRHKSGSYRDRGGETPSLASTRLSSSSGSYIKRRHGSSHHYIDRDRSRRSGGRRKSSRRYTSSDDDSYYTEDSYSDSYEDGSQYSYDTETDSSEDDDYRSRRSRSHRHSTSARKSSKPKIGRGGNGPKDRDRRAERDRDRSVYKDSRERDRRSNYSNRRYDESHRDRDRERDRAYVERHRGHREHDRDKNRSSSVSSRRSHREIIDRVRDSDRDRVSLRSRSPPHSHIQPPPFSHYSPFKGSSGRENSRSESRSASASSRCSSRSRTREEAPRDYVPPMTYQTPEASRRKPSSSSSSSLRIDTSPEGTKPRIAAGASPLHRSSVGQSPIEMGRKSLGMTRVDNNAQLSSKPTTPR